MNLRQAVLPVLIALVLPAMSPLAVAATRGLQPKDLATLDRWSSPVLSPDGRLLVMAKREVDFDGNKAATSLWLENLVARDAAPPVRLTPEGWNVNSPVFSPDGGVVYFLSGKSGSSQLYSIPVDGGTPRQLTDFPVDVGGFQVSPDGQRIAFNAEAFIDCGSDLACTGKRLKAEADSPATGVVYDRMFVRHWDAWNDGRLNRVFVATLPGDGAAVSTATAIASDVMADIPSRPFGDSSEYTWAPDGQSLVLSARTADRTEPWSTNFDLYRVSADGSGAAENLTAGNPAWDTGAVFGDANTLYYRAMKRPGFEADRFGLMALDLATGERREIAPGWDRSAGSVVVSGSLPSSDGSHSLYCAVIVKQVDAKTRSRTSVNELLRGAIE